VKHFYAEYGGLHLQHAYEKEGIFNKALVRKYRG